MEALKLHTVDDLIQPEDERVELIDGQIVRRPMARSEHGLAQPPRPTRSKSSSAGAAQAAGGSSAKSASATTSTNAPPTTLPAGARSACPSDPAAS